MLFPVCPSMGMDNAMSAFTKWLWGAIILGGIGAGLWFFLRPTPVPEMAPAQSVEFPIAGMANKAAPSSTNTGQSRTLEIKGADGSSIPVMNFLNSPKTVKDPNNTEYYLLGFSTSSPYMITYIASTQYFNIELLQEPIGLARTQAEQYLMTLLGISRDQMCRLPYQLGVPNSVNARFASIDLGFSFCPGATELPQ